MTTVRVDAAAEDDLERLFASDPDSAATIVVLLEEMESNALMAETLTQRGFLQIMDPQYEVKRFEEFWRSGQTVYLLKFWHAAGGLVPHRIIYAHHPQQDVCHVLAIVHREFDYESSHPIVQRVRSAYDRLDIPTYR